MARISRLWLDPPSQIVSYLTDIMGSTVSQRVFARAERLLEVLEFWKMEESQKQAIFQPCRENLKLRGLG